MDEAKIDAAIRRAQAQKDNPSLTEIYAKLGQEELARGRDYEAAFLLTQAYVYALEGGLGAADDLHKTLIALGREA